MKGGRGRQRDGEGGKKREKQVGEMEEGSGRDVPHNVQHA